MEAAKLPVDFVFGLRVYLCEFERGSARTIYLAARLCGGETLLGQLDEVGSQSHAEA